MKVYILILIYKTKLIFITGLGFWSVYLAKKKASNDKDKGETS